MGRRTGTGGVTPHGAGIQVTFYWCGKRMRPTLPLAPNAANLKHAHRVLAEIRDKVRHGTFVFADYFPDARGQAPKAANTFADAATAWLKWVDASDDFEHSTKVGYRRIIDGYWTPAIGSEQLASITNARIREVISEFTMGRKTRNNAMIPARAVFAQAMVDGVIKANPMDLVKNARVQREPPDPFEAEEVAVVLAQLRKAYDEQVSNYFDFAFQTGMRPSEQIALTWPDIDWRRGIATVRRARVWGQDKERTKTFATRDVELTEAAVACLQRQKAHTYLAGAAVFHNPHTGARWLTVEHQRRMWERAIKVTGLRYREPYQTRHTYASQALMAGANPMWVSQQMGHKNMAMLLKVYAKWIDRADKSREVGKLNAAYSAQNATKTATEKEVDQSKALSLLHKIGGVDGTRTRR